ncbi:MAG TPA: amidohydrolase [Chloroflexota bacterium]|nr:amidohydrolase [Chloroflexota bacterium]
MDSPTPPPTLTLTDADRQFVVDFRRDLHRHPELAFEEHRTAGRVADVLREAGLEVRTGIGGTGVLGVLRGAGSAGAAGTSGSPGKTGKTGRTILIRADMDALPVQEAPGRPYGSQEPGKMHACGHDGHTAMALTAARVLARSRERLPGNAVFAFQPAEETTGGAARMIQEGALRDPRVDAAIGFHLANTLPVGQIAAQPGPITAATDGFVLTITGKGGHAARPHLSVDPVAVSFQVGTALHTLMTRERSPALPAVLTIGAIHGGTAGNVIADSVELRGTLRTYDPQLREHLRRRVEEVSTGIAVALRAGARLEWDEGAYPPCVNNPDVTALMQRAAVAVLGAEALVEHEPSLGGDDMAFFLAAVPGCYARLGSANAGAGLDAPHHSARFDFDEAALPIGVQVLVRATLDFLST